MEIKTFEVKGTYKEKREIWKPYTKVLTAPNEKQVEERILTQIGSKHRLARSYIRIDSITEVSGA